MIEEKQIKTFHSSLLRLIFLLILINLVLYHLFASGYIISQTSVQKSLLDRSSTVVNEQYDNFYKNSKAYLASKLNSLNNNGDILFTDLNLIMKDRYDVWLFFDYKGDVIFCSGVSNSLFSKSISAVIKTNWEIATTEKFSLNDIIEYDTYLAKKIIFNNKLNTPILMKLYSFPIYDNLHSARILVVGHMVNNDKNFISTCMSLLPNSLIDIGCAGISIANSRHNAIGVSYDQDFYAKILAGQTVYDQYFDAQGFSFHRKSYALKNHLGEVVGTIRISMQDNALPLNFTTFIRFIIFGVLSLAIVLVISKYAANSFIKPIVTLTRAAKIISTADVNEQNKVSLIQAPISSNIMEIQDLHSSLARMTSSLYKKNEELELKVIERTKELQMAYSELEIKSSHKTKFLANISHEIRTPLNAIIGFANNLLEEIYGKLTPQQKKHVEIIINSSEDLLHIFNDILDLSLIEQDKIVLNKQNTDIAALIDSVKEALNYQVQKRNLSFTVSISENLPNIYADPLRIKRVLYNLLTNAIKYTLPNGSIYLEVTLKDEKYMVIKISDTGIGISESDLPFIFDDFFQAHNIYEKSTQGVGLGLSLAKRLVELHNGSIEISSTLNIGTVATITLPITDTGSEDR